MAWRLSSFSPFKLNPSLKPLLLPIPPFLLLSLKRKNSEDPLEMQNRPIFLKNAFFFFLVHRLSGLGSGCWCLGWGSLVLGQDSTQKPCAYWSDGFVLGVLGFFSKALGARRRFGYNLEVKDWNLGLVEGHAMDRLIRAFQIVLAMTRGFKSFNWKHW